MAEEGERSAAAPLLEEGGAGDPHGAEENDTTTTTGDSRGGCLNLRPSVWALLPAMFLLLVGKMMVATLMPAVQAQWFTKCELDHAVGHQSLSLGGHLKGNLTEDHSCKPDYEAAQAVGGMVNSMRNLFSFFSAAFIGRLSDVYGRRPIIGMGMIVSNLPLIILFLTNAESPASYYSACLVAGVLGCGVRSYVGMVSMAYISDTSLRKDLPAQMGLFSATMTISMIVNPLVGHLTVNMDLHAILLLNILFSGCAILYIFLVLPESLPLHKRNHFELSRTMNPLAPLQLLAQSRVMRWVSLIFFLGAAAESGVGEIAFNYVDRVLELVGKDAMDFNRIWMATTGVSLLVSNTLVLRLLLGMKLSPVTLFIISQIGSAIHIGVYIIVGFYPHKIFVLMNAVPTAFLALMSISCNTIVSSNMGSQEQGFALGTLSAVGGIGDVISPFLFSELFAYFGHRFDLPEIPFIVGVLSALAALSIAVLGPLRGIVDSPKRMAHTSHSAAALR